MIFKSRIDEEKATVNRMIKLYCQQIHGKNLCADCKHLYDYAMQRLDKCSFGNKKPVCAKCPVHCYKPDRREDMRKIMQFVGPKMLFHHPLLALLHVYRSMISNKY